MSEEERKPHAFHESLETQDIEQPVSRVAAPEEIIADKAASGGLAAAPVRNFPYIAMLALALFGVAYTSVSRTPMMEYWVILAPLFAATCLLTQWRERENSELNWGLLQTESLHWGAVMVAMYLLFVADVERLMNADATALMVLTILALGTFTAGVRQRAWRVCLVGAVLALGVPIIAWFDEATLLLLLIGIGVAAILALWFMRKSRKPEGRFLRLFRRSSGRP